MVEERQGDVPEAFRNFREAQGLGVLLAMCLYPSGEEHGGWASPKRDLVLDFAPGQEATAEALVAYLSHSEAVQLEEVPSPVRGIRIFRQLNAASSRKVLQPLCKAFFESNCSGGD
jgi:hypothetical protein